MERKELLYEGKAKKVYATDDENVVLVSYKDDATAFNGLKKGTIEGKGVINNKVSNFLMKMLEQHGIETHVIEQINDRETYVKKVSIVPIEVIVRNIAAGSLSKRLGLPEGTKLKTTVLEYCYKNDELGDPMINEYHALAMELATQEELDQIAEMSFKVNKILSEYLLPLEYRADRLQARVRKISGPHHPCRRDFSRYLPLLGYGHSRQAGQGPLQKGPGRCGGGLSGDSPSV